MARNLTGNIYWMQTQSFLRLHLHLKSGCGNGRSGRTLILSITESEHGPPNKRQQYQKYCHSNATAKRKGHLMIQDDEYHQIHQRNEYQHDPPCWLADDFEHDDDVVDGDNCRPSRLSSLFESLPYTCDCDNQQGEIHE